MTAMLQVVRDVPPGWKQMASGKGVDLLNPRAEDVDFNDIAISLSLLCRFNGAMRSAEHFYSVAQHSLLVATLLPAHLVVYGLLHDAHEAFFGDDITPKKQALAVFAPETASALKRLTAAWDCVIWEAARIPPPTPAMQAAIRDADLMAMAIERRDLLAEPADETTEAAWARLPAPPPGVVVGPVSPETARQTFMRWLGRFIWPDWRAGAA